MRSGSPAPATWPPRLRVVGPRPSRAGGDAVLRRGLRPGGRAGRARPVARRSTRCAELALRRRRDRARGEAGGARDARPSSSAARRGGRIGARRRPRWRGCARSSRACRSIRAMPTIAAEIRRGRDLPRAARARRRRVGRAAAEPVRRARPPGRGPGRAHGRGDRGHGLHARVSGGRRAERSPRPAPRRGSTPSRRYELVVETSPARSSSAALRPDRACARRSPRPAAAPRPAWKRSPTPASATAFEAAVRASLERMRGERSARWRSPGRRRRLRRARSSRLHRPDLRQRDPDLGRQFRPIPYNLTLRAVLGFIEETTDPYLNLFRRSCRGSAARSTSARSSRSWCSRSAAAIVVGLIRG